MVIITIKVETNKILNEIEITILIFRDRADRRKCNNFGRANNFSQFNQYYSCKRYK